jgi:hypothetical protein
MRAGGALPFSENFWVRARAEWKGGIEILYRIRETLEDRLAAGESLSEKEKTWLDMARNVTTRYDPSGHKKKEAAPRMARRGDGH